MITKEFTIFYYEQFLYLKNYSPLSTSLFFKKLLGSLSLSPSLQFLRSSLYYLFQIFFFFRKREDSFSSIISSFVSIFHLLSFSLSLPPLSKSKTSFDIFIPRLSRFPPFSHFFGRRGEGRLVNLARSFCLNFSKILKVDNISREESLQKREGEGQRLFTAAAIARVSTTSNPRNT